MEERIVSVVIENSDESKKISIEEYNALKDKKQVRIKSMISDNGYEYILNQNGSIIIYKLIDQSFEMSIRMNNDSWKVDFQSNVYLCSPKSIEAKVWGNVRGKEINTDGRVYWAISNKRFFDIKGFLSRNKEKVTEAIDIIEKFKPITESDIPITLKLFRTFIETGRLFKTYEERKKYEERVQNLLMNREEKLGRLDMICSELQELRKKTINLEKEQNGINEERDATVHERFYSL